MIPVNRLTQLVAQRVFMLRTASTASGAAKLSARAAFQYT
jgi:hypothetical protein